MAFVYYDKVVIAPVDVFEAVALSTVATQVGGEQDVIAQAGGFGGG